MKNNTIKISVRDLVLFAARKGDIDSIYIGRKRSQEGIKVHAKLQKERKKEAKLNNFIYESEFSLKHSIRYKEIIFLIEGRADGVLITQKDVCIEEIKSTYIPLEDIQFDKNHWHMDQAKCYGFIYSILYDIPRIKIILTYFNIETETRIEFNEIFLKKDLENFFINLLEKYYIFAKFEIEKTDERNESLKSLDFPFQNYRKNQRELLVAVYKTIKLEKRLYTQAPTGIGKTISTLFPTIKSMEKGLTEKVFYLTAKTITRKVAEEAFYLMTKKGLKMRTITLYAKEKICLNNKPSCNPIDCEYAKGHFDRVNYALIDLLKNNYIISRDVVINYSKKYNVCPFEFAFDISNFCDCIICDYNYVYDPKVFLKKYFSENIKNNIVLLNDEAHNLLERSKEMFSAILLKSDFYNVLKIINKNDSILYPILFKINKHINLLKKTYLLDAYVAIDENFNMDLNYFLIDLVQKCDKWLIENKINENYEIVLELYFKVLDYLRIIDFFDKKYIFYLEKTYNDIIIKLMCLDTSFILSEILKKVKSSIFFSATLSPIEYFKEALGGDLTDFCLILDTPFNIEKKLVIIDTGIKTNYQNRDNSYELIKQRLQIMLDSRKGNYIVYFPSYAYLEKVYELFLTETEKFDIILQSKNLNEEDREKFLENFVDNRKKSLLAFCVLGGIFSEGIDLIKDKLIGVCIISVGLPLVSPSRNILMDYYNKIGKNGFDFAYKFPGLNKVFQAAGRVIRTEEDTGIIYLIDDRFIKYEYKYLFPKDWINYKIVNNNNNLLNTLLNFWKNA